MTDAKLDADHLPSANPPMPPHITPEYLQRLAELRKPPFGATPVLVGVGRHMMSKSGAWFAFGFECNETSDSDSEARTVEHTVHSAGEATTTGAGKAARIANAHHRQHLAQYSESVQRLLRQLRRQLTDAEIEQLYDEMDGDVQEAIVGQVQSMSAAELKQACERLWALDSHIGVNKPRSS